MGGWPRDPAELENDWPLDYWIPAISKHQGNLLRQCSKPNKVCRLLRGRSMRLFSTANQKTMKGEKFGFRTYIFHGSPADSSGYEMCPGRSDGCTTVCLNSAGHGGMNPKGGLGMVQQARLRKTKLLNENPREFMKQMKSDIKKAKKQASNFKIDDTPKNRTLARKKKFAEAEGTIGKVELGEPEVLSRQERLDRGWTKRSEGKIAYPLQAVFRPNGTTDWEWEDQLIEPLVDNQGCEIWSKSEALKIFRAAGIKGKPPTGEGRYLNTIIDEFPDDIFYDYTKVSWRCPDNGRNRADKSCKTFAPKNYTLVFSRSEANQKLVKKAMARGQNIAVAFDERAPLPKRWMGRRVIDGDKTDLRFLDPKKVVVGLRAKGRARGGRDTSGFIVYGEPLSKRIKKKNFYRPPTATSKGIGERQMGGKAHIPIQKNVSRQRAVEFAARVRRDGIGARVVPHAQREPITHRPTGKTRWAVYSDKALFTVA